MRKIKTFKFNKTINLYCFTDVHIGAREHDHVKFQKAIAALKKDPNGYCFFNGDTLEFIPPNYGIPEGGQIKSTDEQIEELVKLLNDLGKKVLFFRSGNHEARALRLGGVDLAKHISRETKVHQLHTGIDEVVIQIGSRHMRLVTSHGEGGSSKRILDNMVWDRPGADLYFSGHTHEFKNYSEGSIQTDTSTGLEVDVEGVPMLVGGSFLGYADYARSKNMRKTQTGCYILELSTKGLNIKGKFG